MGMEEWHLPGLGSWGYDPYENSDLWDIVESMVEASRNYAKEMEKAD